MTEIIKSALGGVLFIDDAGGMAPESGAGAGASYNKEVCDTLSQLVLSEEYRGKLVVIVAGTKDEIGKLFWHERANLIACCVHR